MLAATSGRPDEGRVISVQISWPAGDGPAGQDLIQHLGRHRGRPRHRQQGHPSASAGSMPYPGLDQPGGHELIQPHRPEEAGPDGIGGVVLIASRAWLNVSFTWSRIVAGVCPSAWSTMYW